MYTRGVGTGVCVGLLAVWCSCRLLGVLKRAYMGYSVAIVVSPLRYSRLLQAVAQDLHDGRVMVALLNNHSELAVCHRGRTWERVFGHVAGCIL